MEAQMLSHKSAGTGMCLSYIVMLSLKKDNSGPCVQVFVLTRTGLFGPCQHMKCSVKPRML